MSKHRKSRAKKNALKEAAYSQTEFWSTDEDLGSERAEEPESMGDEARPEAPSDAAPSDETEFGNEGRGSDARPVAKEGAEERDSVLECGGSTPLSQPDGPADNSTARPAADPRVEHRGENPPDASSRPPFFSEKGQKAATRSPSQSFRHSASYLRIKETVDRGKAIQNALAERDQPMTTSTPLGEDAKPPSAQPAPAPSEVSTARLGDPRRTAYQPVTRSLVISIHDVSQHTHPAVERILEELEKLGVRGACSLLVVPNLHRCGHFQEDPAFCNWLKKRAEIGDEIVIHGYHHCRDAHPDESLLDKITTRFYTKGEGEFFDIAGADALRIVNEARQEFRMLGIEPHGFIAPAWLLSENGERALRTLNVDYTTRLTSVDDLVSDKHYRSQSLVWSVRALWRRVVSLGWNAFLFQRMRSNPLMRISIHPTDIEHQAIWRQVLKLTRLALANRTPIPYFKWVETSRNF